MFSFIGAEIDRPNRTPYSDGCSLCVIGRTEKISKLLNSQMKRINKPWNENGLAFSNGFETGGVDFHVLKIDFLSF